MKLSRGKPSSKILLDTLSGTVWVITIYLAKNAQTDEIKEKADTSKTEDLAKLENYRERFKRNAYHLQQALSSVRTLESVLDTLGKNPLEDVAIQLKILQHRTNIHLEEVMKSLKEYEAYPNLRNKEILESAINRLRQVDQEIIRDSLKHEDVEDAFLYAINALSKAEVTLSEAAYKTNEHQLAKLSLKQAQLHLKNALLMDYDTEQDSKYVSIASEAFRELDSLINSDSVSLQMLDHKLSLVSRDLDSLLQIIQKK